MTSDQASNSADFFTLIPELMAIVKDGSFATVNPAWTSLGWTEAQLIGQPVASFIHPDDWPALDAALSEPTALRADGPTVRARFRTASTDERMLRWSLGGSPGTTFVVARDVTEWVDARLEAERSSALSTAVLATAVDPIIVINARGIIQRTNKATTDLFGYPPEAMLAKNVSMLMPDPYQREHDGYLTHYLDTGDARVIGIGREVEALKADGTIFPMSLSVSEVFQEGERLFTGIIHDLTARRAASEALTEANQLLEHRVAERTEELALANTELARSNRDLEQFAYIASHDLQSPLRNVRQGLELLQEHLQTQTGIHFDGEAQELRTLTLDAVTRMESLIRGLLSYSRVQRSTQPPQEPIDLNQIIAEVIAQLRMDLDDAGASIEVETLPTVIGDATQLHQLIQNLIQNAIKYRNDKQAPHIRVSAAETPSGFWTIAVSDNGVGIDPQHHDRIFDLFRRGHAGYEGVGLGLAICQSIAERHGGRIWVDSEPGSGATFRFTLKA